MVSTYIRNRIYSSIQALILSFGLLLIFSSFSQLKAEEASEIEEQHSCDLLQNSQNPLRVKNATPNGKVAVLTGLIKDRDTLKKGVCAGTEIGLNPHRKIITLIMNEEGEKKRVKSIFHLHRLRVVTCKWLTSRPAEREISPKLYIPTQNLRMAVYIHSPTSQRCIPVKCPQEVRYSRASLSARAR